MNRDKILPGIAMEFEQELLRLGETEPRWRRLRAQRLASLTIEDLEYIWERFLREIFRSLEGEGDRSFYLGQKWGMLKKRTYGPGGCFHPTTRERKRYDGRTVIRFKASTALRKRLKVMRLREERE